jgi:hypothetical protein
MTSTTPLRVLDDGAERARPRRRWGGRGYAVRNQRYAKDAANISMAHLTHRRLTRLRKTPSVRADLIDREG